MNGEVGKETKNKVQEFKKNKTIAICDTKVKSESLFTVNAIKCQEINRITEDWCCLNNNNESNINNSNNNNNQTNRVSNVCVKVCDKNKRGWNN